MLSAELRAVFNVLYFQSLTLLNNRTKYDRIFRLRDYVVLHPLFGTSLLDYV